MSKDRLKETQYTKLRKDWNKTLKKKHIKTFNFIEEWVGIWLHAACELRTKESWFVHWLDVFEIFGV